ncbi:MAG: type II toxin-antitoxin system PemK/MazF family toxin [Sporichthyaceae bacterium]
MLTSGDVVTLDLGVPIGREAGFRHPAVVVTAQALLDSDPNVVHVVPFTSTIRSFGSEVTVEPGPGSGLRVVSSAQCQHVRSVSARRIHQVVGNVGTATLAQIREVLAVIFDLPP